MKTCIVPYVFCVVVAMATIATAQNSGANSHGGHTIRVVSYNIKRGLGNDEVTDLNRTAQVLRRLRPDLVGLQEVDVNTRRCGNADQPVELGKTLAMHHAFGPFMDFDGGKYGLAILSRHPIVNTTIVRLPTGNEPRVALASEIQIADTVRVMLIDLHFDWVSDDQFRFAQATELKAFLGKLQMPYILLGDFNDTVDSRTLELFKQNTIEAEKPDEDHFTFSSIKPSKEIDFVFAAPPDRWVIGQVDVIDEPVASDHRPVLVELTLKVPAAVGAN